ncbi:hypothetical protein L1987_74526 [Smallanthus sonchifolius]|uniref:Uncharacterized protein n=1 Tax=Smallanthus sonchifolius TaxID=185202 RepID=A0ACB9A3Z1_9ASTR|nr:hypothetical protein L1987_74526 [Smallanthus sonchifolius]
MSGLFRLSPPRRFASRNPKMRPLSQTQFQVVHAHPLCNFFIIFSLVRVLKDRSSSQVNHVEERWKGMKKKRNHQTFVQLCFKMLNF